MDLVWAKFGLICDPYLLCICRASGLRSRCVLDYYNIILQLNNNNNNNIQLLNKKTRSVNRFTRLWVLRDGRDVRHADPYARLYSKTWSNTGRVKHQ